METEKEAKQISILDEAKDITGGDRMEKYGHPRVNFGIVAEFWSSYLETKVDAGDVAMLMSLFKIAREKNCHQRDNLVDLAGYARNKAQIDGRE